MTENSGPQVVLLRHTVATLAYRSAKVVRGAPAGFEHTRAGPTTRSAGQILAHMTDLIHWATRASDGDAQWQPKLPTEWDAQVRNFFAALQYLDDRLSDGGPLAAPAERLVQGPIADAFTHVGQLATLRRLAGAPVRGEDYFRADIVAGRVGMEQSPPASEFD